MNWEVRVRKKARKFLRRFPNGDQKRIVAALKVLAQSPYTGDIGKLEGEDNSWRRRIGAYRIFYEIKPQERIIFVFRIERRTSKTY